MKRFDFMNAVVVFAQLLLAFPCFRFVKPLPAWLEDNLNWHRGPAFAISALVGTILWFIAVMLTLFLFGAFRRR